MNWRVLFFDFDGRASRRQFWIGTLLLVVVAAIPIPILRYGFDVPSSQWPLYNLPWALLLGYPAMAVLIKRMHDRDRSGWWAAPSYPLHIAGVLKPDWLEYPQLAFSLWILWECGCRRGTAGPNRFGDDPMSPAPLAPIRDAGAVLTPGRMNGGRD
jgi:uncharacterized membrane protein YhaH (DUF805 family)